MRRGLVAISLVLAALAAGALSISVVDESLPLHIRLWRPLGLSHDAEYLESPHTITIALKQQNLDLLHQTFKEVSNPLHKRYAKYLDHKKLRSIVAADESSLAITKAWLSLHGAKNINVFNTGDALRATLSIGSINKMFGVTMDRFENRMDGRVIHRSYQQYALPSHIAPHIDLVLGLSNFPVPSNRKSSTDRIARFFAEEEQHTHITQVPLPSPVSTGRPNAIQGVPVFSLVMIGVTFTLNFYPQCQDGSLPTSLPLCASIGSAPSSLALNAVPANAATPTTYSTSVDFSTMSCAPDATKNILCVINGDPSWLPWYIPVNLSASITYGEASGPFAYNAQPIIRTPAVTPQTLYKLYNIPPNFRAINETNSQCVVEFEQQYYSASDLQLFFSQMGLPGNAPVTVIGPNPGPAGGEANLDIQYIMALAPGVPTTFWSIAANSSEEIDDILTWEFAIGNTTNPPLVNSLSYGMAANNVDKYLGNGYLARSDVEFQKLALLGISIVIASGDTGAGNLGPPPMNNPTCDESLNPTWPSQSPYVTSVGSTIITPESEPVCYLPAAQGGVDCAANPLGEITVSVEQGLFWTSGSGFSNEAPRPDYQQGIVDDYLTLASSLNLLPPDSMFNASNRGYPDVATVGHNLLIAQGGTFSPADGTSASAPIFAGILTLLNDIRLNNGKPPLGFVNPLLYLFTKVAPSAWNDVTVGSNRCGFYSWTPLCCDSGYHALPGWDATSGLGTPNFTTLQMAVLRYPKH